MNQKNKIVARFEPPLYLKLSKNVQKTYFFFCFISLKIQVLYNDDLSLSNRFCTRSNAYPSLLTTLNFILSFFFSIYLELFFF